MNFFRSTDRRSLRNVTDEARDKGVILIPIGVRDFIPQELEVISKKAAFVVRTYTVLSLFYANKDFSPADVTFVT